MAASSHLADNLALLEVETAALLRTASTLDEVSVREGSLCEGWSRAHVLSHLARNADALGNLVHWAVTGEPTPMYASPEARDADIEDGARRPLSAILADLEASAARFAAAAPALAGGPEAAEVEMRGGVRVSGGSLPTLRLREVVFHHVDLHAGYGFADADAGFVRRSVDHAVGRLHAPDLSLTLRSREGGEWTVGGGGQEVTGTDAALLTWLARGVDLGLSSDRPVPAPPPWG
ncbi:maleylpyruvate isomerase [Oryzihumus leptocrescens]|uniref:Maleylpyruvate isomerase n=1 Tax=Oryzihumus leptocrescens TaxID=297536 RepID=A0A542ZJX2_9MICO|nr:maleylpyruvate isomerase family mycothiol-dependent enzyme [Oryzihumus leptocrescens]TQL60656.1 maleylpyruvate isomerase [Oryzihumus leptocrescens]